MKKKIDKYIKDNPDEEIHLVDKIFGKGNLLIKFNYRQPYMNFKQCYLARVDKDKWDDDRHEVMRKVQDYLAEDGIGVIYKEDFAGEEGIEDDGFECCIKSDNNYCENHEKEFDEWFKDQFPKIDLEYGGVAYFDEVE
jgi:hypothetical protein